MITDTVSDLELLATFIDDILNFSVENDDKLKVLKNLLKNDEKRKNNKVIHMKCV